MALAVDTTSSLQIHATESSLTWSHTCTGSNRGIIVVVGEWANNDVTGVTYGGVSLTQVWAVEGASYRCSGWALSNPASGANNVVVTLTGANTNGQNVTAAAISFTGAHQTTASLTNTAVSEGAYEDPVSVTASTASDEIIVDCAITGAALSVGANQTQFANTEWFTNNIAASYQAGSDGGVMSWTRTGGAGWSAHGAVSVKPVAGGGSAYPYTGGVGDGAITQSAATQRIRGIVRELGGVQTYSAGTVKARGKAPVSGGTITFAAGADYSKATLYLYTGGASQAYGAAANYFKTSASTAYSYVGNGVLVFSNGSERIIGRVYERGGAFHFSGGAVYSKTSGATNYDYSGLSGGAIVFSNVSVYFYDPSEREEKPRLRAISHEALPTRPPGQDGFYTEPGQDGLYGEYPAQGFYADIGYRKEFKPFHRATFTKEGKPN